MDGPSKVALPRIDTNSWQPREDESIETRLVSLVAEILGLERSNVQLLDSFADLGGNETSAAALRKACLEAGIAVTTKDILECPTLAQLQTCVRPCDRQLPCPEPDEAAMIPPLEVHKATASRLAVEDHAARHSRHSSRSSAGSNANQQLSDVEETLSTHKLVSRIITTKPMAGLLEGKLVAFLTLTYYAPLPTPATDDGVHLIAQSQMFFAGTQIATLRRALRASQRSDIIPEAWVVLDEMPLTGAGEIDRRRLRTWAQNMNEETYRRIMSLDTKETLQQPSTQMEKILQRLVGRILQVPREQIGVNFSFSRLGGDEAAATELVALCRQESIHLDTKEVLQDMRLADLAALGHQRGGLAQTWEDEDRPLCFDLSPMQQLYVRSTMGGDALRRATGDGSYRFNQSFLLRLKKQYLLEDILAAVEAVAGHHSMLRSRFTLESGTWSQTISPEVPGSYAFNYYSVSSDREVEAAIEATQTSINVETGPVFAVDYFQTHDGQQLIYLAAHHLVVDLPSWRVIIHDFDELLEHGSLSSQRSIPFPRWIELQKSTLKGRGSGGMPPISGGYYSDSGYWGLKDQSNTYGEVIEASFSLSSDATSTLEGSCNQVFRTESVEIYLAALLLSFAQTFHDRPVPIVWNQEHGRDTLRPDIDVTETVGWFTSLCPIVQKVVPSDDIVGVLRRLKDGRRAIPGRGSHFFASQFYKSSIPGAFLPNNPFEVVFSYAGSIQNLERKNGVLEQLSIPGRTSASNTADIGPKVGRISVFEVNTVVDEGAARIKFVYNRNSKLQDRIAAWISNFEHVLLDAVSRLKYHVHELTMADIPHLDVTYDGLAKLNKHCLTNLKITSIRDVEAVHPVTATQQAILMRQTQDPDVCFIHTIHEFSCRTGKSVDTERLCSAWQLVSSRHAALRTIFSESSTQTGLYDQIVLRKITPDMLFIDAFPPDDPVEELNSLPNLKMDDNKPPHRLSVCRTPTRTLIKLDINSAICDSASVQTLINELWRIYAAPRTTPEAVRLTYSDYLDFLKTARQEESLAFWQKQLEGINPCFFPRLGSLDLGRRHANTHLDLEISTDDLATFSEEHSVSAEAVMQLAWGLVLRAFTGRNDFCFGWQSTGRDDLVSGSRQAVGSFANVITCTMSLFPEDIVLTVLESVGKQLGSTSVHQYVTLPEMQRALGLRGDAPLFNSCLRYTDELADLDNSFASDQGLDLRQLSQQQTSPFEVAVHVRHAQRKIVVDICHWNMTEEQAAGVANTFGQALRKLTASPESTIQSIDLFNDHDYAQLVSWTGETTRSERDGARSTIHELVERHAHQTPTAQAVCAWDGELTYHQLMNESTKFAHYLINAGVGPRTVVPVVLDKNRWAPVALLAVLKAGAAFVLADAEDLSSMKPTLEKLSAGIAISAPKAASVVCNIFRKLIILDDDLISQIPHPATPLAPVVTPEDPACVLFPTPTSKDGSGIAFSHAAMSIAFLAQGPAARIGPESRVMQLSSFSVDIALSEMFTTLVQGGCICVPSPYERLQNFAGTAERLSANWTYMTPFLSRQLDPTMLPTIKVVCFRTRNLDEDTYGQWARKATVIIAYGTMDVCPLGIAFLEVVDPQQLKCVGRPSVGNFWIVNPEDNRKLMPVGTVGELVIESPTLGAAYPTADLSTTLQIAPATMSGKMSKHKTYHRVRYLEGGIIEFISGKRREELEVRGKEINPTDIEKHIRRCLGPGVEVMVEAIVPAEKTPTPVLAAFLEFTDAPFNGSEDPTQLSGPTKERVSAAKQLVRESLRNKIEPHLIPSIFIPVRRLPITPSLKVNRRRLQKMIRGLPTEQLLAISESPSSTPVGRTSPKPLPLTEGEQRMRTIWAKVLGVDEKSIEPGAGFISAGGDDILAAKLVVACRHAGIPMSVADALGNVTLTQLSQPLSTGADGSTLPEHYSPVLAPSSPKQPSRASNTDNFVEMVIAPKLGVDKMAIKDVVEATATQTRCIEAGMLRGRANVDYFIFEFTGFIDVKKLEEACQTLVTIHPVLRTAFVPYNRQVYQAIVRSTALDFQHYSCNASRQAGLVEKIVKKDQSTPVAFSTPMTKFTLLDGGKSSASTLILRLCKAQYDDFSVALLVRDLKQLYDGTENPPRRPTYCEFVRATQTAIALGAEQYWKTLLDGSSMTQVVGHSKPHQLSTSVKTLRERLIVRSLANLGISFDTILKTAWSMVLANLSGSSDIIFGEIIEGRHVQLEGTQAVSSVLGPTTNAIPVRVQFPDTSLTPFALLHYVHDQRVASIPYENMGFLNVVEKCTLWPYWTRFSTVVQHRSQDAAVSPEEPKAFRLGLATCKLTVVEPGAKDVYDLLVQSIARRHDIDLRVTFCDDRVPSAVAENALRLLCETINMLTGDRITEPIIPSGYQYRAMEKKIPVPPPFSVTDTAPTHPLDDVSSPIKRQPSVKELSSPDEATKLPEDQIRLIQAAISKAWSSVLKPRTLGVPEEHLHTAAFYDLWGSLIPAAQLAAHLNRELPRLNLPGLDASSAVTMEDIITHPTMLSQFQLVARKMTMEATGPTPNTPVVKTTTSITAPTPPQSPRKNRAATFGSRFRRFTTTLARPSMPGRTLSASEVPFSPGIVSPGFLPAGAEHQQQQHDETPPLPALPYSPGSPEGVRVTAVSRSGSSAAASLTAGSSSSGASTRGSVSVGASSGIDEMEGDGLAGADRAALMPAPLRRTRQVDMTVLTGAGEPSRRGDEDIVSPLTAVSPNVRFWDVGAALSGGDSSATRPVGVPRTERETEDIFERMGLASPTAGNGQ